MQNSLRLFLRDHIPVVMLPLLRMLSTSPHQWWSERRFDVGAMSRILSSFSWVDSLCIRPGFHARATLRRNFASSTPYHGFMRTCRCGVAAMSCMLSDFHNHNKAVTSTQIVIPRHSLVRVDGQITSVGPFVRPYST